MIIEVKQNQSDSMSGFVYAKGISVIHLSLVVCWFYVIHPDLELSATFVEPTNNNKWLDWHSCAAFGE